jgi:hypothetical protein
MMIEREQGRDLANDPGHLVLFSGSIARRPGRCLTTGEYGGQEDHLIGLAERAVTTDGDTPRAPACFISPIGVPVIGVCSCLSSPPSNV